MKKELKYCNYIQEIISNNIEFINFFILFSRFECCLKREQYNKWEGKAEANWGCFWKLNKDKIIKDIIKSSDSKIKTSVNYLFMNQPDKQFINSSWWIYWNSKSIEAFNPHWLINIINTIRNNLFHWGKYNDGPCIWAERNKELLEHWIIILEELVKIDPKIKSNFYCFE